MRRPKSEFSPDDKFIEINFHRGGLGWSSDRMYRLFGYPTRIRLCGVAFKDVFGTTTASKITIRFSTFPIEGASWEPLTIRTVGPDSPYAAAALWDKGHRRTAYASLYGSLEEALLAWLGEVDGVFHICAAAWENE